MTDAISRSAAYISLSDALDTIYNIDISDCTDIDDIVGRIYEAVGAIPDADVAPVVHEKDIRSSVITVKDYDEWQDRIILADEATQVCSVYYADGSDAVPVVRCVDCKYRCTLVCPMYHTETCLDDLDGFDDYNVDRTDDDGFCHLGKRWDGEDE
jgi:hypothetical protein